MARRKVAGATAIGLLVSMPGTRWHILATHRPAGATSSELSAVSCTSASACIDARPGLQ